MAANESKYARLSDSESDDSESGPFLAAPSHQRPARHQRWIWVVNFVLLVVSSSLFIGTTIQQRRISRSLEVGPEYTREYERIVKDVGEMHPWQFAGSFGQESKWRGDPNPELDAAWDAIATPRVLQGVTKEDVVRLGKLSNSTVQIPEEYGGGYMASVEATHQMHCLNMLRKASYREYYKDKEPNFFNHAKHQLHLDHCIEALRQVIMCNADMHIITYDWVGHVTYPWPDFSINKQCRNYESLMDWIIEREARAPQGHSLLVRPPNAGIKPIDPVDYVHEDFS